MAPDPTPAPRPADDTPDAPASLAAVLAQLSDAVAVVGLDGATLVVNRAAQRLLGLSADRSSVAEYERQAETLRVDGTPLPRDEWPIVRALRGESVRNQEMVLRTPAGRTTAVAASAVPLHDEAGAQWGAALVVREINEEFGLRTTLDEARRAAERRAAEQGALAAALADVTAAVDVDEQLRRIARRARALAGGDYAAVAVVGEDGETTWRAVDGNRSDAWRTVRFAEGRGTAGRVIAADAPLVIAGFPDNPDFPPDEFPVHTAEGMRSALGVPLRADGRALGVVVVGWRRPEYVSAHHTALVQSLADVAAITLTNARLVSSLETQRARLATENERLRQLVRVTALVGETLDRERVCDAVLDGLGAGNVGADAAAIYLYDAGARRILARRARYFALPEPYLARALGDEAALCDAPVDALPFVREVVEGRRTVSVPDAAGGDPLLPAWFVERYGIGGALGLPLNASGETVGALFLSTALRPHAFAPADVAFAESLGGVAAAALYNARSYHRIDVQRAALADANAALEQTNEELQNSAQQLEEQATEMEMLNAELRDRNDQLDERVGELDAVLDQMADGVLIANARGEFVRINPAAERIYGRPLSGIALEDWVTTMDIRAADGEPIAPDALPSVVALRERRVVEAAEWSARRADGTPIRLLGSSAPLLGRDGALAGAVTVYRDITERVRLVEQVQQATRLKERFFAQMSHELRTPINAILGYSGLIAEGIAGEVPPKAAEMIGRINRSGRHLLELVNDVLDISRLEAGKVRIECRDFDLAELVRDTMLSVDPQARAKGLALRVDAPPSCAVWSDPARVRQIVLNLASNAVKFTERGEVAVTLVPQAGDRVAVRVADTGPGIAEADRENVFAEFVQVGNRTDGTGLGLAISRRLATLLGGALTLASEVGRGSTFELVLPNATPAAAPAGAAGEG